jgi:aubergine-like protein
MPGYLTSIRITENGIGLLTSLKNKFINSRTCADKYEEIRKNFENGALRDQVLEFFKNKSIMATYGNHKVYRIDDVSFDLNVMNKKIQFKKGNNEEVEMTLEEYYATVYNLKVDPRRRDYPLLISYRNKEDQTSEGALLVMEFCFLTGLEDSMRKDEEFTKKMTGKTKLDPVARMTKLKEILKLLYKRGNQPRIKSTKRGNVTVPWPDDIRQSWGLDVGDFMNIRGRVLNPPNIIFRESK